MKRCLYLILCTGLFCGLLSGCGKQESVPDSAADSAEITQTEPEAVPADAAVILTETTAALPPLSPETVNAYPAETLIPAEQAAQLTAAELTDYFTASVLSAEVLTRITGISYQENPNIAPDALRYLRVLHYDAAGDIRTGELICNAAIAADLLVVFRGLYDAQYPIARMVLIDEYGGDDEASMAANNTSCFNYRVIAGSTSLSRHALGMAIDINPLNNPYITFNADGSENISPANAQAFADRSAFFPMKIDEEDLCYTLFTEHGFTWGGSWDTPKDYQHFEK